MPDPVAPKSALEALETAIEPVEATPAAEPPAADPPAADPPAAETPAAEPKADDPLPPVTEGVDEGDPADPTSLSARRAAQAAAQTRDPSTGKFAAKNPDGTIATPAAKPAVAAVPAKPADPLTDPLPTGTKAETAARFEELRTITKQERELRTAAEADRDLLLESVRETGADAEQFQEMLDLVKNINSSDPSANEQAYQVLLQTVNQMANKLGKAPPGVDPLSGNPDLIQMVSLNQMTRQAAETVAEARRQATAASQRMQELTQRQQAEQRTNQALAQARADGAAAMQRLEGTLRAVDPHFAAKQAAIMADPGFKARLKAAHPSQWAALLQTRYEQQPAPIVAQPAAAPARVPSNQQPLRGHTPAGGTAPAPKSAYEALDMALGG